MVMEQDRPFNAHADPIANALDITPNTAPLSLHSSEKASTHVPAKGAETTEKDIEYARENLYHLAERGRDALDGILELANQSQHPRAFEVAGNLISQVADVTEKLGDLQEKMKKLKEVPNSAPKNVTNALFVGSTAELQKMLKGN